jgi:lipase
VARLHVTEWGTSGGEPVVCIHGLTGHGGRFRELAGRLADKRVVAVDLRGHGRSVWEAPWALGTHLADLVETAEELGIGTATWVGHSLGGRLVAELAASDPDRVARAVLLDPAMHIDPATATERAALARADASFESPDEAIGARLGDGSLFTTPRSVLEEEADMHLVREPDSRWRWRYSATAVIVAWSELATAAPPWPRCPTLVVLGERSWVPNRVPRMAHLTSVPVPGGHSVLWDDFDETAEAVARFLGST